jgi:hypothetical protein
MNGSYIKLPPGKTTKNHERLFVKHQYCDYSKEEPTQDEIVVQFTDMSPNAAFPLKLHETLSAIEKDGLASIVGWLPHGVSAQRETFTLVNFFLTTTLFRRRTARI